MLSRSKTFIIILNYNSSKDTIQLYNQLIRFNFDSNNISIIDNNSTKEELNILLKDIDKDRIIINSKNLGYAGGNNIGILKAIKLGADYVWVLNPDVRVEKETLTNLLKTIANDRRIAAIGPRICFRDDNNKIFSDGGIVDKNDYLTYHINYNKQVDDDDIDYKTKASYINGDSILLNINAIKNIGLFYGGFFLYYEETEWCNRAINKGWKIEISRDALVYHSTSNKGKLYRYYMIRNRLIFAKIDKLNYSKVRNLIFKQLIYELLSNLKRGKFPKNNYFLKLKGFVTGSIHNLKHYHESIFTL